MAYLSSGQLSEMGFRRLGSNVRISDKASLYNCEAMEIGDHSRIDDFCVVSGRVVLGRNVHIAPFCLVAGGVPGVTLGDFSGLAYHVQVFSQSDDYLGHSMTNPTVPARFKRELKAAVHLGRHVIVGAGSVILPGTVIAEGCSVGALSLVRKSTQPWGVYAGNPARRVKARSQELLQLESQYLAGE